MAQLSKQIIIEKIAFFYSNNDQEQERIERGLQVYPVSVLRNMYVRYKDEWLTKEEVFVMVRMSEKL